MTDFDPKRALRVRARNGSSCPKGDIRPRIPPEAWPCFPHAHQPLAISLSLAEPFVSVELFYLPIAAARGKLAPDQAWVRDKTAPVLTIVPSVATPIVMPLCCSALMVAEADPLHSRSAGSELASIDSALRITSASAMPCSSQPETSRTSRDAPPKPPHRF